MSIPRLSRTGVGAVKRLLSIRGFSRSLQSQYFPTQVELNPEANMSIGIMFVKHHKFFSTTASGQDTDGGEEKEMVSVTFVDKDGEENHVKVPVGMSLLEAAHENDMELEGASEGSLACPTGHVIVMFSSRLSSDSEA